MYIPIVHVNKYSLYLAAVAPMFTIIAEHISQSFPESNEE